jgi:hypothetical protein
MSKSSRSRRGAQPPTASRAEELGSATSEEISLGTELRFTLSGLVAFTTTLVLVSSLVTFAAAHRTLPRAQAAHRKVSLTTEDPEGRADPAPASQPPWGELRLRDIELDRPDEYASFELSAGRAAWVFPGATREQVASLFASAHLPNEQIARALGPALSETSGDGIVVHPDLSLALALTPEDRAILYRALGRNEANRYMRDPFRTRPGEVEKWSAQVGDAGFGELVQRLLYPCGKLLCFSDYELGLSQLPDDQQRILFAKALTRRRAVMARLRVRPDTDLDKLVAYWAPGARAKDVRPLLESMQRLPEGGTVNLAYALPPFARLHLYTYPTAVGGGDDPTLNCHWSTLNFFNETPDSRFADLAYLNAYLGQHFFRVGAPARFGDRIFLVNGGGFPVHSAVYLAGDVVFTKNGFGVGQPWMLMHLDDMLDYYGFAEPLTMLVYRDKND